MSDDAVLRRAEELITVTVAGTTVVHDPFEDRYVKLSAAAALLWQAIDPEASLAGLADRLVDRYGIPHERALEDARTLAASLAERGLVAIAQSTGRS